MEAFYYRRLKKTWSCFDVNERLNEATPNSYMHLDR